MVDQANRNVGQGAKEVLADAGYASEANLKALDPLDMKTTEAPGGPKDRSRLAGSNPPHYSRTITLGVRVAVFCDADS